MSGRLGWGGEGVYGGKVFGLGKDFRQTGEPEIVLPARKSSCSFRGFYKELAEASCSSLANR